jgi:hypothetical protein
MFARYFSRVHVSLRILWAGEFQAIQRYGQHIAFPARKVAGPGYGKQSEALGVLNERGPVRPHHGSVTSQNFREGSVAYQCGIGRREVSVFYCHNTSLTLSKETYFWIFYL